MFDESKTWFFQVNLGERVIRTPPRSANKAAHSGFDTQGKYHQLSKTGVSGASQKFKK